MSVRNGPGAAVFPPYILKLHLQFPTRNPSFTNVKLFWRQELPRLKYHNPSVPMIVNRTEDPSDQSAVLTIYMEKEEDTPALPAPEGAKPEQITAAAAVDPWQYIASNCHGLAPAPAPLPNEKIVSIDVRELDTSKILTELLELTGAVQVEPTDEDMTEMKELAEQEDHLRYVRAITRKKNDAIAEEKRMLEKARQEAAALKE